MQGLIVDDVHVSFGDIRALDGMTFRVEPGQMMGFLGPNGAGKTTSMRCVLGLVAMQTGNVRWNDRPIDDTTRRHVGYMPEERGLYPRMKVLEQVVYFGRLAGLGDRAARSAATSWLERLDLAGRYDSHVQELSHGNQQRVQLAVALVHSPSLLVLDEPFSGLDPVAVSTMSAIIAERAAAGAAVLFSSHQLDLVEGLCDDVVIVSHGRAQAMGRVGDLRAASPRRVLRVELEEAAPASDTTWPPKIDDAEVIVRDERIYKAHVARHLAPVDLLAAIGSDRAIRSFSLEPPPLSEIFLEVVS